MRPDAVGILGSQGMEEGEEGSCFEGRRVSSSLRCPRAEVHSTAWEGLMLGGDYVEL